MISSSPKLRSLLEDCVSYFDIATEGQEELFSRMDAIESVPPEKHLKKLQIIWKKFEKLSGQVRDSETQLAGLSLFATIGVFRYQFTLEELSQMTSAHPSRLRNAILQAIQYQHSDSGFSWLDMNCGRFDLFLIDRLAHIDWQDSFDEFGPTQFDYHRSHCLRCAKLWNHANHFFHSLHEFAPPSGSRRGASPRVSTIAWKRLLPLKILLPTSLIAAAILMGPLTPFLKSRFQDLKSSLFHVASKTNSNDQPPAERLAKSPPISQNIGQDMGQNENSTTDENSAGPLDSPQESAAASKSTLSPAPATRPTPPLGTDSTPPTETGISEKKSEVSPGSRPTPSAPQKVGSYFFLRWDASSDHPTEVKIKILELLAPLQVERASPTIDLGGDYSGGFYFHFFTDESNVESILNQVQSLDIKNFKSAKIDSPRRVPPGRVRIVFLLK